MQQLFLFFLFSVCGLTAFGQSERALRHKFFNDVENRLRYAYELEYLYTDQQPDSLHRIARVLMDDGIRLKNESRLYYGKFLMSLWYKNHGEYAFVYEYLRSCERYYQNKRDWENISRVQDLIGQTLFLDKRYDEAIDQFVLAMESFEKAITDSDLSAARFNLAEVFYATGAYTEAEKELDGIFRIAEKEHLEVSLRKAFSLRAKILLAQGNRQEAAKALNQALQLAKKHPDAYVLGSCYNQLGILHVQGNELDQAESALRKAMAFRLQTGQIAHICESAYNLGELYFLKRDFDRALHAYQQCLEQAQKGKLFQEQQDALNSISGVYEELKDFPQALKWAHEANKVMAQQLAYLIHQQRQRDEEFKLLAEQESDQLQGKRERILSEQLKEQENSSKNWMYPTLGMFGFIIIFLFTFRMKD